MSDDAPEDCRLCTQEECNCRKYLSDTLRAMERLAEVGEITITSAPIKGRIACYEQYNLFMRDFFIATGIHWKRKE